MPQIEGGYVSLSNGPNSVYNSTTEPTGPQSMLESVKRAIGSAIGNNATSDNALVTQSGKTPIIVSAR